MEIIAQGAEAIIYKDGDLIIKDRFEKKYRISSLDVSLREERTRREAKILSKINKFGFTPRVIKVEKSKICIELLKGKKVRDVLNKKNYKEICEEIGKKVAILHDNEIIHQDLTTSNMIFTDQVIFIDFGLSFVSIKAEDKAVDLYLLKKALESKHHEIAEKAFESVLEGYKTSKYYLDVMERLKKVEARGRNKAKQH